MKRLLALAALSAGLLTATPAHALAGDPIVTATCDTTVVAGTPVHCTVTVTAPYAPTNGSQKITYRTTSGSTINVANYTVIPVTYDGTAWQYTYTPSVGEIGRTETFSVTAPTCLGGTANGCPRIPRTVTGYAYFTVTA